jgi:hypothetical protein
MVKTLVIPQEVTSLLAMMARAESMGCPVLVEIFRAIFHEELAKLYAQAE